MKTDVSHNSRLINILLVVLTLLIIYLNAVTADFLIIDDGDVIKRISTTINPLGELFNGGIGRYYRPLSTISFMLDSALFGANPAGCHALNIFIHLCNALLLYYLVISLPTDNGNTDNYALVASLLFAVNPLCTEAVIWISARPDLLSCSFFLLSMILIVRNDSPTLPFRTVLLFFTFLCALLSKESSIGLFALWLLYYSGERGTISLKPAICITLALGLALLIYFTLRNGFFLNADTGITQVMRNDSGPSSLAMETFSAYGFYIRKLFYPFPLTFIITGIDKARYAAFFLALLAPAAVLYHRNRHLRLPLLVIITGLIPPVLALVGRLPFSPYAERYLYLPLTGFALLITLVLKRYLTTVPQVVVVSAILLMAIPTVRPTAGELSPAARW